MSWQLPKHKNCCQVCMYNSLSLIYRWAGISQVMSLLQNIYSLAGTVLSKFIVSSVVPKGTQCKMFCFLSMNSLLFQWAQQNPSLKLNLLVE